MVSDAVTSTNFIKYVAYNCLKVAFLNFVFRQQKNDYLVICSDTLCPKNVKHSFSKAPKISYTIHINGTDLKKIIIMCAVF